MSVEEVTAGVLAFIRESFLSGDPKNELDDSTPLLEWGVLNSMNTALLLTFIRDELGVPVPATKINGENFKNVRNIAAMVLDLDVAPSA
ncbi:acyl carrier protein [Actinomadura sp. 9N215]|uniref:acyl carrier protein n=1 Tax=Actinomadura sp. 9N215 TaxID=3375150 RepID=UPI0037B7992A